ncbi:MAG: SCO family protein [Gammaproteobacteria bacterium]|nr:SCO family protein [Gammaproteobacteria bacterium]MDH3468019.1 SCO family protein [Gammaproteobacteria bacterium]
MLRTFILTLCIAVMMAPTFAHQSGGVTKLEPGSLATLPNRFPVNLGGPFKLIDHHGATRTDHDFPGQYLLIFFGYANCKSMCMVGLRRMTEAIEHLGKKGDAIQPLMITVDPDNDTQQTMREALPKIHPRLLGLTGSSQALAQAYDAYKMKPRSIGLDPEGDTVVNHTSYIYLVGLDGKFLTLIPPIIASERIAEIILKYLS